MNTVVQREPAEQRFAEEVAALAVADTGPRPAGWQLSPGAVRDFISGCKNPPGGTSIAQKVYGTMLWSNVRLSS
jgi:hypothetical protein